MAVIFDVQGKEAKLLPPPHKTIKKYISNILPSNLLT